MTFGRLSRSVHTVLGAGLLALAMAAHAGSYEDFFIGVQNDNASTVNGLLQRGFDPNTRDPKGNTGLILAIRNQSPKVASALLAQKGIDVDALNTSGESALMMAGLKGDLPAVKLLLDRGARVNQPGWAPLHYAATGPELKVITLLLERGADINAASPNGTTPLMMAAQYGPMDGASLFIEKGADPKRRNKKNLAASDFAKLAGRDALAASLEKLQR
ncbi:ankyrin repeat domain-containing protein [soil metagenome]